MMHKIKKIIALLVLFFVFIVPASVTAAQAKNSSSTKQTQRKKTSTSKKKCSSKKSAKNNKKSKNSRKPKNSKKHSGKKSKKRKKRHRGRATRVSSHETAAQKKQIAEKTKYLKENPDYSGDLPELAEDSLVWPVKYGYISRGVRGGHSGLDIMSRAGEPIYAVADGVVTFISIGNSAYSGYGKLAVIHHPDKNLWSIYSHCAAIYLNEGQQVKRGQLIATVGRTGLTTTNHLHFELRTDGRKVVNPLKYLPQEGKLGHKYIPH